MHRISIERALEASSPGRFQVESWQDRQYLYITVRLLGPGGLFVPSFCRKKLIMTAALGAVVAAAFGELLAYIEDQRDNATMCNMGLAEFVSAAGRTAGYPFS